MIRSLTTHTRSKITIGAPRGPRGPAQAAAEHVQTQQILVTLAERPYPFPSRTRKLSSPAPKILRGQPFGKIGRRRDFCVSGGSRAASRRSRGAGYPRPMTGRRDRRRRRRRAERRPACRGSPTVAWRVPVSGTCPRSPPSAPRRWSLNGTDLRLKSARSWRRDHRRAEGQCLATAGLVPIAAARRRHLSRDRHAAAHGSTYAVGRSSRARPSPHGRRAAAPSAAERSTASLLRTTSALPCDGPTGLATRTLAVDPDTGVERRLPRSPSDAPHAATASGRLDAPCATPHHRSRVALVARDRGRRRTRHRLVARWRPARAAIGRGRAIGRRAGGRAAATAVGPADRSAVATATAVDAAASTVGATEPPLRVTAADGRPDRRRRTPRSVPQVDVRRSRRRSQGDTCDRHRRRDVRPRRTDQVPDAADTSGRDPQRHSARSWHRSDRRADDDQATRRALRRRPVAVELPDRVSAGSRGRTT